MKDSEKSELAHPHDLLVRNVLADADLVADMLRNYLDSKLVSALELDSLKREVGDTVSSGLSKLVGDLRYSTRFKGRNEELKVFLMLEHQSRPDHFMSFRMLEYVCAVYRQQLSTMKKGMLFPYPLAVVLHHGESPWKKIPPMRELIAMTPDVESDILGLPIRLIDVATMSVDELRGHPMVCALLDSLQSASMGVLESRMQGIFSRLRGLGKERRVKLWLMALTKYYGAIRGKTENAEDELAHAYTGLYGEKEAKKMATTMLEQIMREGEVRGEAKGEARGKAKGKIEGKVEGKIESIMIFLELRFGKIPAAFKKKLVGLRDDDHIDEMLKLAATCRSLKEFQNTL